MRFFPEQKKSKKFFDLFDNDDDDDDSVMDKYRVGFLKFLKCLIKITIM